VRVGTLTAPFGFLPLIQAAVLAAVLILLLMWRPAKP
jgi:hypothetical protein